VLRVGYLACGENEYFRVTHLLTLLTHELNRLNSNAALESAQQAIVGSLSSFFLTRGSNPSLQASESDPDIPVLFEVLIDISETYKSADDVNMKMWHGWVIGELLIYV